ncbi:MAG: peptidylprolyl isomerase [Clostridiales Family XIII bacterium]|nr:peptidylprolyl isomerase [Clostridiales Family XIII bacterium]
MKYIKEVVAFGLIAALALALSFGACSKDGGAATGDGAAQGIIAKVGAVEISQTLIDHVCAFLLYNTYGERIDSLPEDEQQIYKNQILVSFIIQAELMEQHLQKEGAGELDADAQARITSAVDEAYADETVKAALDELKVERSDAEYVFEVQEYYQQFKTEVAVTDPVTDDDIQAFYIENEQYFVQPKQWQASHILIEDADHTSEKRSEIESILEKAQAGDDFAELAKEYSNDTSADAGGDLGYFDETVSFVPEFKEAVFALEPGEISDIVETEFGYHIIKLTDIQEESTQPLADMEADIKAYLEDEHTGLAIEALKDEFTIEYFIEVDPATGEPPTELPEETAAEGAAIDAAIGAAADEGSAAGESGTNVG